MGNEKGVAVQVLGKAWGGGRIEGKWAALCARSEAPGEGSTDRCHGGHTAEHWGVCRVEGVAHMNNGWDC